jgi:hypothetical protein
MRYVIEVEYDETHQECTAGDCTWRGGRYDEPFRLCPRCFSALKIVAPDR